MLSSQELERYDRHLKLPGFGLEKQLKLKDARVLIVGAGGLGCPIGLYLAASGVGVIGVVDFDVIEQSNLQRQVAHRTDAIGQPKASSLVVAMQALNPLPCYTVHPEKLTARNVTTLIAGYDLVLDGSDNFSTRFLLADACFLSRIPLVQAAVSGHEGQLALYIPGEEACHRCLFPEPPGAEGLAPCNEAGVLGVVPGTLGLLMATEAIKYLTGAAPDQRGKLLLYNAWTQTLRHLIMTRDEVCPLCGPAPVITSLSETPASQSEACQTHTGNDFEIFPANIPAWLEKGALLLDVREAYEYATGHIPGAMNLPLSRFDASLSGQLPEDRPIIAYCKHGARSLEAMRKLRTSGYRNAYIMTGGITAWDGPVREDSPLVPGVR